MDYGQVLGAIENSHPTDDWVGLTIGTKTTKIYFHDVNLRIECSFDGEDIQCEDFKDEWANNHPNSKATGYFYNVYYGSTLLKRVILVNVDGGNASLPVPDFKTKQVRKFDYVVANLFNTTSTLREYMQRSKLAIP